jgi:anion-transporting  ArsA/GET3 family ATPase
MICCSRDLRLPIGSSAALFVKELLKRGSLVVMLGTGGVGKTTVAAALGLAAARQGLNTALITVDPARRLREALGLQRLSAEPTRIDRRRLRAAGLDGSIRLSAMTLDVKRTWDALVQELIESPEARRRILTNSFYHSLTQQFAGAEAYAALEQLDELQRSGEFEMVIVDTPPAAHAFEFFETPRYLVRLLDSHAARWLLMPEASLGRNTLTLANRAARFVISQLEAFTGTSTLSAISDFFGLAAGAATALGDRFRRTEAVMRSSRVSFVLVTTADEDRLHDAVELIRLTRRQNFRLRAIVLNRILDERTFSALRSLRRSAPAHLAEIARLRGSLGELDSKESALISYLEGYRQHQMLEIERGTRFGRALPAKIALALTPAIDPAVRDLRSLAMLSEALTESMPGPEFLDHAAEMLEIATPKRRPARHFMR